MATAKVLWSGAAAGEHWELQLRDVVECRDEISSAGSRDVVWNLVFVSRTGARLEVWWDPAARVLGGTPLRGWSKHLIGAVKRRLCSVGDPLLVE